MRSDRSRARRGQRGHWHDHHHHDGFGGRRGDIPLHRIGIQLFSVRDLLADSELDLPANLDVPRRRRS